MPVMSKTGGEGIPGGDFIKMIETIELYLQQTREVLDRIEGHIKDLKKDRHFQDHKTPAREDAMKKYFSAPSM